MKDPLSVYDRIPDAVVDAIAKGSPVYQYEARNMARELIKLRASSQKGALSLSEKLESVGVISLENCEVTIDAGGFISIRGKP